ncbi:MAG: thrombospondin type 3 repeat-containing protein [Patescibacteria group bacterium]|nr:thrombospondin type 3 repeat-containing protein [Patescibacteria group bacterium]
MEEPQNRFTKEQKIGLVLLSAFVVLAISFGVLQMRNTMYRPFALNNSIPAFLGDQVNTPDALRYRDTDLDGLNDFDELYVYGTSPYLADTDSDGLTDKQETEKGTNPNCAEGRTCSGTGISPDAVPAKQDNAALYDMESPGSLEEFLQDPTRLREILVASGMSMETLNQISDEDLQKWAAEIFASSTLMNADSEGISVTATAKFVDQVISNKE